MFPFSLVGRFPVAAALLLVSLTSSGEDQAVTTDAATSSVEASTPASSTAPVDTAGSSEVPPSPGSQSQSGQSGSGQDKAAEAPKDLGNERSKQQDNKAEKSKALSPDLPGKQVDATENSLIPEGQEAKRGFGYDVFGSRTTLIADGPIDDNYVVSPGDEIVVTIWGEIAETLNLVVSREGVIDLPEGGGRIQANGISLAELKPQIIKSLSLIYASFINAVDPSKSTAFVDIRLGKLRDQTIFVLGEISEPGAYRVSPGVANVVNLINNAGGVRPSGSLRNIQIRRGDGRIDKVDLYGFFLSGDLDLKKIRVRQGDHVVVPLKRKSVTIQGEVLRPHNYEIVGDEGLLELVELAGGFKPDAYAKQVQLRRYELNRGEVLLDVDLDEVMRDPAKNVPLMNGDTVTITKNVQVRKNTVSIKGDGITRAGTYEWTPGMSLSDLIAKANGLREDAFLDRADLIRTEDDFSKKLMVIRLGDFYKRDGGGTFAFVGNREQSLPLREMDELIIQSLYGMAGKDPHVTMEGHVKYPGRFVLARDMTLYDLIFARGGFQDEGFRKSTFMDTGHVFRRVPGEVGKKIISFNLGALLNNDPAANLPLQEEDVIRIYSAEEMGKRLEVRIEGLVNKPGNFPMSEELTLEDLLVMAGGLQPGTDSVQAVIARADVEGNSRSIVVPVNPKFTSLPKELRTPLESNDKISIVGLGARDRYVSLEGHVKAPGKFIFTKDMTLKDLISTRGGFQDAAFRRNLFPDMGHIFRKVPGQVGKKIIPFDVGALLGDDGNANLPLEEDDVVRIYSYDEMRTEQRVTIDGLVKQPGSFPMAEGMTLEDLIMMAGGLLPEAFKVEATIARSERDAGSTEVEGQVVLTTHRVAIDMKNFATLSHERRTPIRPDDRITIRALPGWERSASVLIQGEVKEPGHYSLLEKNETLSAVIHRAGGLKESALPEGATVLRSKAGTSLGLGVGGGIASDAEDFRIPVNLGAALTNPGGPDDIVLNKDDRIFVPSNPGIVEVRGAVKQELTLKHKAGRSLTEYIDLCGGFLDKADVANIRVFTANRRALPSKNQIIRKRGRLSTMAAPDIPPGSIIDVPFLRASEQLRTVEVNGAVIKPVLIQHIEGAPLGYYLNLSGGFTPDADLDNISVLLPDGGLLVKTGNQPFNPVLPGGSKITVTSKTTKP